MALHLILGFYLTVVSKLYNNNNGNLVGLKKKINLSSTNCYEFGGKPILGLQANWMKKVSGQVKVAGLHLKP